MSTYWILESILTEKGVALLALIFLEEYDILPALSYSEKQVVEFIKCFLKPPEDWTNLSLAVPFDFNKNSLQQDMHAMTGMAGTCYDPREFLQVVGKIKRWLFYERNY